MSVVQFPARDLPFRSHVDLWREREPKVEQWRRLLAAARDLRIDQRIWSVRALIKHNLQLKASDEAHIFAAAFDDRDGAEYWRAWLCEIATAQELAHLLALHTALDVRGFAVGQKAAAEAIAAARAAGVTGQSDPIGARPVVEWLVANPMRRHHVPASLRAFLQRQATNTDEVPHSAPSEIGAPAMGPPPQQPGRRRPGPKPDQRDRVLQEMRKLGLAAVDQMKIIEWEGRFSASADTCRRARDLLFAETPIELRTSSNTDK